jgi:O-methyltransferase
MRQIIQKAFHSLGYSLIKTKDTRTRNGLPVDMEPAFAELYAQCKPYTMTSPERMYALYKAVEYVVKNEIAGDFVECGVWRGGSAMLIALTLQRLGATDRSIYLYDTFEGMSEPTAQDKNFDGKLAETELAQADKNVATSSWCFADLADVQQNMGRTNYPTNFLKFVQGKVEDTLPQTLPQRIALLRLDTDWYASTYHELVHLYPLLQQNAPLIIDDYGHWQGAREAVDTYFLEKKLPILLNRIDYTGRIMLKTQA